MRNFFMHSVYSVVSVLSKGIRRQVLGLRLRRAKIACLFRDRFERLELLGGGIVLVLVLTGCGVNDAVSRTPYGAANPANAAPAFPPDSGDLEKLARLWEKRSHEPSGGDYPVGAGDVIEISVPAIEELRSRTVRLGGDGTISLPYIGKMEASGLTEEELQIRIAERLKQYMYNPKVIVFVKEYRSRQVAVLGAVGRPGMYNLSSGSETLLDLLTQAGGIAPGADPKLYFIPAEPAEKGKAAQIVASLPAAVLAQDPAPMILKRTDPILIDIKQLAFGGTQQYLSIGARPGDVIMVPGGGQVLVEGWVEKPGAYPISPGLTVTGAVVQAGGPLYPADVTNVKVIRTERSGARTTIVTDLQKIKRGETNDIALQGGDIVELGYESGKLMAYGVYKFFATAVNIGIGGQVPIFK